MENVFLVYDIDGELKFSHQPKVDKQFINDKYGITVPDDAVVFDLTGNYLISNIKIESNHISWTETNKLTNISSCNGYTIIGK